MDIDELSENFELLDDWEDKYRYLIDLGEKLPPFPDEYRTDEWKVSGCQSQVWLKPSFASAEGNGRLQFVGDSDAAIVRGLIAVVLVVFGDKTREDILTLDVSAVFSRMGLADHLSPSRRNGLGAMVEKIRFYALKG